MKPPTRRADGAERVADKALRRKGRIRRLRRVIIDRLLLRLRAGLEGQEALGKAAHHIANRLTGAGVAEASADPVANPASDRAERIADEALRRKGRIRRLRRVIIDRLLLRAGVERQEALGETAHSAADRLTEPGVAEAAADEAAERRADGAERVADKALRRETRRCRLRDIISSSIGLRAGVERQQAAEHAARDVADLPTEILVAEGAANRAAAKTAERAAQRAA